MTVNARGDRLGDKTLDFDKKNPGHLEALYSGFAASFFEKWRKVVLSNCEEMVRAKYEMENKKISEARIESLAHLHDNYLDFLIEHFEGRKLREDNVKASLGYGA